MSYNYVAFQSRLSNTTIVDATGFPIRSEYNAKFINMDYEVGTYLKAQSWSFFSVI